MCTRRTGASGRRRSSSGGYQRGWHTHVDATAEVTWFRRYDTGDTAAGAKLACVGLDASSRAVRAARPAKGCYTLNARLLCPSW